MCNMKLSNITLCSSRPVPNRYLIVMKHDSHKFILNNLFAELLKFQEQVRANRQVLTESDHWPERAIGGKEIFNQKICMTN